MRRVIDEVRAMVWQSRLSRFGSGSRIDGPAHVHNPRGIVIGNRVHIWRGARIEAFNLDGVNPRLTIGDDTVIQPHVHIGAAESVRIGQGVLMASHVYITDHDHDWSDPHDPVISNNRLIVAPVEIGDYVWLGERVMVLKGVTIGERSIIGAGSIVTRHVPPYSVAVGSPACVVRRYDLSTRAWVKV